MKFKYLARTPDGNVVSGVVEAESESEAEEILWRADLLILSLKRTLRLPALDELLPTLFGIKRRDVINFSRDLATLLESGIPLLRSLEILGQQARKQSLRKVLEQIIEDLQGGESFSAACAKHKNVFPAYYIRLLQVSEGAGNLPTILKQLAEHMQKDEATSGKLKSSLAYPLFVLILAFGAVFIMFSFVLPALSGLFKELGGELPLLTRVLMALGDFLGQRFLHIFLGLVGLVVLGWLLTRTKKGKIWKDSLMLKIPLVSEAVLKGNLSRLTRNLYTLLRAGVVLTEALPLAIQTTNNMVVREALTGCLIQVHSGLSLSRAMAAYPLFPPLMSQMIAVGEETGKLDSNLEALSNFYEEETDRAISRMLGMLGPALVIFVGGVVGFVAVTLFSSIYSTTSLIK